jgi:phosphotransferase system enzyme I (PtsI)
MAELNGIPVCGGSRVGRALLYEEAPDLSSPGTVAPEHVEAEVLRLERAAALAEEDLDALRESLGGGSGVGGIFRAHALMLEALKPDLDAAVRRGLAAEHAVATVCHEQAMRLARSKNQLMAQRSQDIVDLERRLLRALGALASSGPAVDAAGAPAVVVARDLTPSETAGLEGRNVAALALELGGVTSHTAVIAKSLGIPCVVGVEGLTDRVRPGDVLWVDGTNGRVVIEPDPSAVKEAQALGERYERLERTLLGESHLPPETLDGHRAVLLSNIEFPLDVEAGMARGAAGVGLYRTEFLYDARNGMPTEEDHVRAYRSTLQRMRGGRLTVRTFDFGSDKEGPGSRAAEPNPALGVRSLRWCFAHPQPFLVQLRALLRVAREGDVRIMLPMVGSLEELRRAKAMVADAARALRAEGVPHRPDPPVGIMIEIPGAAVIADLLAREVDFFSIGTNDLIQYDLAVDRMNPRVAPLFRPSHPSLLRLLQRTIDAAAGAGKPVTMCGEMGGHSIYTVLLFGMGLREFSLTPGYIPRARRLLRSLTLPRARALSAQCLALPTAEEVEAHLRSRVQPVGAG